MVDQNDDSGVLAKLARLVGVAPRELVVAAAKAEAPPVDPAALLARRKALADRRRQITEVCGEAARALADRLGVIQERASGLRKQLAAVVAEAVDAESSHALETVSREHEASRIEAELRETSSPRLATFIRELRDEADALRRETPLAYQTVNPLTEARRSFSSYPQLCARLAAIHSACETAEGWKVEPLTDAETEARLEGLRAGLPAVEVRLVAVA